MNLVAVKKIGSPVIKDALAGKFPTPQIIDFERAVGQNITDVVGLTLAGQWVPRRVLGISMTIIIKKGIVAIA